MGLGKPKPPKFKTEEEKVREAFRLLPIIEPLLPQFGEFHILEKIHNLNLSEEDKSNIREVYLEIINLLLQKGTYKISRPNDSHQHIEKIIFNHIPKKRYNKFKRNHITGEWEFNFIEEYDYDYNPSNSKEYKYVPVEEEKVNNIVYEKGLEDIYYEFHKGQESVPLPDETPKNQPSKTPKIIGKKIITLNRKELASKITSWTVKQIALFIFLVAVAVVAAYIVFKFKFYPH